MVLSGMGIQFTRENASEMARKGNLIRWSRERAKADPVQFAQTESEDFREKRLSRVRAQLQAVDRAIEKELGKRDLDASQLDRLASAAIRLNEQERQLSNRSLPPTLKANAAPSKRKASGPLPDPTD